MKTKLYYHFSMLALAAGVASGQNLLINGSFEFPNTNGTVLGYAYFPSASTNIASWTTFLNGVEYAAPSESPDGINQIFLGLAEDGTYEIDLDPLHYSGGGIQQTFPTFPGTSYSVSFYMGNMVYDGRDGTGTLTVSAANVTNSFAFTNTQAFVQWGACSFNFTAASNSTTLAFWSFDNSDLHFSLLDNVSVTVLQAGPPVLVIELYPGVQINGTSGQTYVLEYSTPPDTNLFQLRYVTLPTPSNLVYDVTSPGTINRAYRAFQYLSSSSLGSEVPVNVVGLVPGIQLTGAAGHNYTIQNTDSLSPTNWQSLSNFTLITTTSTSFDPGTSPTKQRYYRGLLVY
jgi:hypothetical protein